jgi:hypothetical protein
MIARVKPRVAIPQTNAPVIATERLILRRWQEADIEPNTQMLADPVSARFITSDGKPVTEAFFGWRNAAIMAGHWALHGFGMFVVEEKQTARFVGRVGPWWPAGWPGLEVGWGIASPFRGKVTRSKPQPRPSIGFSRSSRSIKSLIASTAKTSRHKTLPGGSAHPLRARSTSSATSPTCG